VSYPHIQTHRIYSPAAVKVQVLDLKVAAVKVGYIMGSGDQVPDALRRMGLDVTLIDKEMLSSGDLSRFDTIVVGVRASEARPDFVANTGRLRDYMERGGTLIVQYQQTDYINRDLPPYPVKVEGNPRVTDETATVKILVPRHPVFSFPNTIHRRGLPGLGAGAQPLFVRHLRRQVHGAARGLGPGREAAERRRGVCRRRQGALRLHVVRVVPASSRPACPAPTACSPTW
jgi:hypothetical protein